MNDITRMPVSVLYDLLSSKTLTLLEAMSKKDDPLTILLLKLEVQTLQAEITQRKSSNLKGPPILKFSKN